MVTSPEDAMLAFYRTQSAVTDPKGYAYLHNSLPETAKGIGEVFQNVLLHNWKAHAQGLRLSEERRADIEVRPIARLLARIHDCDARSWHIERPVDRRVVVDCRHFATLLCSVLRHRNIPARTRHGFAAYLQPGHSQSHVICEYWESAEGRWVSVDADTLQPAPQNSGFMSADVAWRGVASGQIDPAQFGYAPDLRGAWCVRWEMVRDFAALNKQEMLTFDIWGMNASYGFDDVLSRSDTALLDQISTLLERQPQEFENLRAIYETSENIRVPPVIRSQPYTTGLTHMIDLALDGSM